MAIQKLLEARVLYIPSLEDVLYAAYMVADLQSKLRERNLRGSGSKKELIDRLKKGDRPCAEQMAAERRVTKCMPETITILGSLDNSGVKPTFSVD
jgi:hypothetical protein